MRIITSRLSPVWKFLPLIVFAVLLIHGATLGLTDDEAYYWVLAQRPAWGYAFHPPAVAWSIALSQLLTGVFLPRASAFVVRLPSAAYAALILWLGMRWVGEASSEPRQPGAEARAGVAILSFAGFFALAWMMVPDLPLFTGWALAFLMTWRICFGKEAGLTEQLWLGAGVGLSLLSKYSGALIPLSSLAAVLLYAPRGRRLPTILAGTIAVALASLPILIWNAQHDWASILYQIRDRHGSFGGGISWLRYARFWAVELLIAGPPLVCFAFSPLRRARSADASEARVARYVLIWALPPAAVFFVQPLWSDFKPHWAFAAWLPWSFELAWSWSNGRFRRGAGIQAAYGLALTALVLVACHVPIGDWVISDPRLDVTNDLYGWSGLGGFLQSIDPTDAKSLPVIGSRYQTAAQAAFALGDASRVTLLPRDLKERDEWPRLRGVAETYGPDWPALEEPVLFVADNRYSAPPAFKRARCRLLGEDRAMRMDYLAKTISVWKCEPVGSPL